MASRLSRRAPGVLGCALTAILALLVAAGCGGDEEGERGGGGDQVAQKTDFPQAEGKTLADLRRGLGPGPVLATAVSEARPTRRAAARR